MSKEKLKVVCVLYDDPVDGYPPKYARPDIPQFPNYPDGQTMPSPKAIDFNPGDLLGCVSGELGLRKFVPPPAAHDTPWGAWRDPGRRIPQPRVRSLTQMSIKVPIPYLFAFLKFSSFLRSTGCVTLAIRMCANACKLSAFYDQILISYRFIIKPTF